MAGGSLGRIGFGPPEDMEVGSRRLKIYDDAVKTVQERGLTLPSGPKNGFDGEMPSDITSLDDNDLGDLLSALSEQCGYVEAELAKAQIKKEEAQADLEFKQASVRILARGYRDQDSGRALASKDKDDVVITNPSVVEAQSAVLYTEAVYTLTKTILNRYQRNWDTVSRRITQRGQDVERMKRDNSVAGMQQANRFPFRK